MKKAIPICLLLAACKVATPVEQQRDSIIKQIDSVEQTLPTECKTDGVQAQLSALRSQVQTEWAVCSASIDAEKTKTTLAKTVAGFLGLIVLVLVATIIKKGK